MSQGKTYIKQTEMLTFYRKICYSFDTMGQGIHTKTTQNYVSDNGGSS